VARSGASCVLEARAGDRAVDQQPPIRNPGFLLQTAERIGAWWLATACDVLEMQTETSDGTWGRVGGPRDVCLTLSCRLTASDLDSSV
jgi:hypothetical protein